MKPEGVESGVPEVYSNTSPGRSSGVLPTTPGPSDLLQAAERVGDLPVTAAQLHRDIALVLDADLIGPDDTGDFAGSRLVRQILRPDGDAEWHGVVAVYIATMSSLRPRDMGSFRAKRSNPARRRDL